MKKEVLSLQPAKEGRGDNESGKMIFEKNEGSKPWKD